MYYSYITGIKNVNLGNGFIVTQCEDDFLVSFPKEKVLEFEKFIENNLPNGFWNEYVGETIVFIFKFSDGKIQKYVLNENNHDEILKFCCQFAGANFASIKDMILDNDFYSDKVITWN